jgi:hypothetical protein
MTCIRIFGRHWFFLFVWRNSPTRARATLFLKFLDSTEWHTTVGRTPLDDVSTRRRDLYLTTHNTHKRQTSMPLEGFELAVSASERPETLALDRSGSTSGMKLIFTNDNSWSVIISGPYFWEHSQSEMSCAHKFYSQTIPSYDVCSVSLERFATRIRKRNFRNSIVLAAWWARFSSSAIRRSCMSLYRPWWSVVLSTQITGPEHPHFYLWGHMKGPM